MCVFVCASAHMRACMSKGALRLSGSIYIFRPWRLQPCSGVSCGGVCGCGGGVVVFVAVVVVEEMKVLVVVAVVVVVVTVMTAAMVLVGAFLVVVMVVATVMGLLMISENN